MSQLQQQQPGLAPSNARDVQGIAGLFGQSEHADCQLVFLLERPPPGLETRPYEGSSSAAAGAGLGADQRRCGQPLPAHSAVLRLASDKFAAQLDWLAALSGPDTAGPDQLKEMTRMGAPPTAAAATATPSSIATATSTSVRQRPEVHLTVGGEEELPAARAAIHFAYTGRVEASGGIREVLQVRRQAAYLQMEGCMEACLAAVREKLEAGGGAGAGAAAAGGGAGDGAATEVPPPTAVFELLYNCGDVWPDPSEDTAFAALLTEAKRRLVAHFGDALAVLNKQQLYEQMRALPAEGLEALLESDDFGTDSESSVVLVLAEWMAANHSRTDAVTRKQLCELLRLVQCSRSYLSWVLPALAARHEASPDSAAGWLPLTRDDATCLLAYSSATEKERRAITGEGRSLGACVAIEHWPANWLSTKRRRQCLPAEDRTIGFSASLAELTKAFEGLKPAAKADLHPSLADTRLADHFGAQGWEWSPYVRWKSGNAAASVYVKARMPAALGASASAAAAGDKLLNGAVVTFPRLRLTVCGAGGQQAWSKSYDSSEVVKAGHSWGWGKALELREAPATDQPGGTAASGSSSGSGSGSSGVVAARWAGYLQGGTRLTGSVTLRRPPPEYYA